MKMLYSSNAIEPGEQTKVGSKKAPYYKAKNKNYKKANVFITCFHESCFYCKRFVYVSKYLH